jgi:adenylate kinase
VKIIAFTGVSGVGKSTFLSAARLQREFLHLIASELIKVEKSAYGSQLTSEDLRKGNIDKNQAALITAFDRHRASAEVPLVLDAHTIIDTPDGFRELPASVFAALCITGMVFLHASPEMIFEQRGRDTARVRPQRSIQQIAELQDRSLLLAADVTRTLGIPLTVLNQGNCVEFLQLLR